MKPEPDILVTSYCPGNFQVKIRMEVFKELYQVSETDRENKHRSELTELQSLSIFEKIIIIIIIAYDQGKKYLLYIFASDHRISF